MHGDHWMDGRMARRKRECGGKAGWVGGSDEWMETIGWTGGWPDGSVNVAGRLGGWVDRMNGWRPLDGRADGPTEA